MCLKKTKHIYQKHPDVYGEHGSGSGNFTVESNIVNVDSKEAMLDLIGRIRSSEVQLNLEPSPHKTLRKHSMAFSTSLRAENQQPAGCKNF